MIVRVLQNVMMKLVSTYKYIMQVLSDNWYDHASVAESQVKIVSTYKHLCNFRQITDMIMGVLQNVR